MDLLAEDDNAGWQEYVEAAVSAAGHRTDLVVVGQSMGAFTASLLPPVLAVSLLVLVNAMIPAPGETAATGGVTPRRLRRSGRTTRVRAGQSMRSSM